MSRKSLTRLAVMVVVTTIYVGVIFGGFKSRGQKAFTYKLRSVNAVEFQQAPPGRLVIDPVAPTHTPDTAIIPLTLNLLGQRTFQPKTSILMVITPRLFHSLITINAP